MIAATDILILSPFFFYFHVIYHFQISKSRLPLTNQSPAEDGPAFSVPYDIPLTKYTKEDVPWFIDMLHNM